MSLRMRDPQSVPRPRFPLKTVNFSAPSSKRYECPLVLTQTLSMIYKTWGKYQFLNFLFPSVHEKLSLFSLYIGLFFSLCFFKKNFLYCHYICVLRIYCRKVGNDKNNMIQDVSVYDVSVLISASLSFEFKYCYSH